MAIETASSDTVIDGLEVVASPRFAKTREWTKLIAITGSAQVVVQAIGFVSGILVIRLLPVEEYAYYTIANTMLGTMTLLADGGIASGVMSQGGKVWQDKKKLGAVLATGMSLRRQFAVYSLLVSIPILYFLLMKQGASWIVSTMIVLSLLPAFFSALSGALLEISAKLHQDIAPLQAIQVASNSLRLMLSTLMLFIFPYAALAILASATSQVFSNWRLRRVSNRFADRDQPELEEVRQNILRIVKRVMPGAIYVSVSAQISIWLISIFGTTQSIAEIGALGRLAMVLTVVSSIVSTLVIPRFARLQKNCSLVKTRFLQIQAVLFTIGIAIVLLSAFNSDKFLWLLGDEYQGLSNELIVLTIGACLSLCASVANGLNASRGYLPPGFVYPATAFTGILIGVIAIDKSSVFQILSLNASLAMCSLAVSTVVLYYYASCSN